MLSQFQLMAIIMVTSQKISGICQTIRPVMGLLGLVAGAVGVVGLYYARRGE